MQSVLFCNQEDWLKAESPPEPNGLRSRRTCSFPVMAKSQDSYLVAAGFPGESAMVLGKRKGSEASRGALGGAWGELCSAVSTSVCPGEKFPAMPLPIRSCCRQLPLDWCLNTYLLRGSFLFTRNTKAILHLGSRMFSNGPWTVYQPCLYPVPTNLKGPPLHPNEPQGTSSTSQQGQPQGHGPDQPWKLPISFSWSLPYWKQSLSMGSTHFS